MSGYTVFIKPKCSFSSKAKSILTKKGKKFTTVTCKDRDDMVEKMKKYKFRVPNALTFPRVFFNKKIIGGFDELQKKLK
jgi:glutaredoxin